MARYRKKPIEVEAVQWMQLGDHPLVRRRVWGNSPIPKHCFACGEPGGVHGEIDTLEGCHIVCPGDFIITGVKGEHYPCKPDIFEQTYEEVK